MQQGLVAFYSHLYDNTPSHSCKSTRPKHKTHFLGRVGRVEASTVEPGNRLEREIKAYAPNPTLDPSDILKSIGITSLTTISPVQGGMDTALWRVEHGSVSSALRLFRPNQQRRCKREIAAMETAKQDGVPVPEIREAVSWQDRPFLLLSWCKDQPLPDVLQRRPHE